MAMSHAAAKATPRPGLYERGEVPHGHDGHGSFTGRIVDDASLPPRWPGARASSQRDRPQAAH